MGKGASKPGPIDTKFQVIGAGLSRTGTKTLREALEILLDGPVHDGGSEALTGPTVARERWFDAMQLYMSASSVAQHRRLLYLLAANMEGYVGSTDVPGNYMVEELLEVFPDAVVIATTREKKGWMRSLRRNLELLDVWWAPYATGVIPGLWHMSKFSRLLQGVTRKAFGPERWNSEADWDEDKLEWWNEYLRKTIPEEKLFFYKVKEGWEPLCRILKRPVPDVPFPHENTPDIGKKVQAQVFWTALTIWSVMGSLLVGGAAVVFERAPALRSFL